MDRLTIWYDTPPLALVSRLDNRQLVAVQLALAGVRFEHLFRPDQGALARHGDALATVQAGGPYRTWQQVGVDDDSWTDGACDEHTHAHDEVRLWLRGTAVLSIHHGGRVLQIDCTPGVLVAIPSGLRHWLRPNGRSPHSGLMLTPHGLVPPVLPTGSGIADGFPPHGHPSGSCPRSHSSRRRSLASSSSS